MNVNRPNIEFCKDERKHDFVFRSPDSAILMNKANDLCRQDWGLYGFARIIQPCWIGGRIELDEFYQFRGRPPQIIETAVLYY